MPNKQDLENKNIYEISSYNNVAKNVPPYKNFKNTETNFF